MRSGYFENNFRGNAADVILINPFQLMGGYFKTIAPPLGLAYLASSLEQNGIAVKIIDMIPEKITPASLIDILKKESPKLIGLPVDLFRFDSCVELSEMIKKEMPESILVGGGAMPSIHPEILLEHGDSFDYLLRGEAEYTIVQLYNYLFKFDGVIEDIHGICYRDENGNNYISSVIPRIKKLDDLPFPAYHLLCLDKYVESTVGTSNFVGIVTSRGCPFRCIFCSTRKIYGKKYRARSPENIIAEIEYLQKEFDVRNIVFWDDTFTVNKNRVIKFCKLIVDRRISINYRIRSRVDRIDDEMLCHLKASGCSVISYGVESGSQKILDLIKKGITIEQVEKAFSLTRARGIKTMAYFMIGNFGETVDTVKQTIEFAKKIEPNFALFTMATPLPGTDFFNLVREEGSAHLFADVIALGNWHNEPSFVRNELSKETLLKLHREAYVKFYIRPYYILRFIKNLRLSDLKANISTFIYLLVKAFGVIKLIPR